MSTYRFTRANVDDTINLVYDFVVTYIRDKGYPPAVRDICAGVGIRSTSTIHGHLKRLQKQAGTDTSSASAVPLNIPDRMRADCLLRLRQVTWGRADSSEKTSNALSLSGWFSPMTEMFSPCVSEVTAWWALPFCTTIYVIVRKTKHASRATSSSHCRR